MNSCINLHFYYVGITGFLNPRLAVVEHLYLIVSQLLCPFSHFTGTADHVASALRKSPVRKERSAGADVFSLIFVEIIFVSPGHKQRFARSRKSASFYLTFDDPGLSFTKMTGPAACLQHRWCCRNVWVCFSERA